MELLHELLTKDLSWRADSLPALISKCAEQGARRNVLRVCNAEESLKHRPDCFGDFPGIVSPRPEIFPQNRMTTVMFRHGVLLDIPGRDSRAWRAAADVRGPVR